MKFGRFLGDVEHLVLLGTYTSLTQEYAASVTWLAEAT
jgi:hypothetical protein